MEFERVGMKFERKFGFQSDRKLFIQVIKKKYKKKQNEFEAVDQGGTYGTAYPT